MEQFTSRARGYQTRTVAAIVLFVALARGINHAPDAQGLETSIDNNQPFRNPSGHGATFGTQGFVDLTAEYFRAQGTNGRSCATCHTPQEAWSISPAPFSARSTRLALCSPDVAYRPLVG